MFDSIIVMVKCLLSIEWGVYVTAVYNFSGVLSLERLECE